VCASLARLRAADVLALVAAATIPLMFLHRRYQAHFAIGRVDVYSSDLAVLVVVVCAAIAGFRFGWEPLRRGRTLWLLMLALLGLLLLSCFWRPVGDLGTHLTTWTKLAEYALLAPAIVLLFRRTVDLDRFLVVFVAWALAAGLWGALMFFGIVDDPEGPRPGQREVAFLGHQDYGAFTGAALAVGLAAIALGARRRLAIAAVIGGGLGVALDASIFAYLGTILAAIAVAVVTQRLGTLTIRRLLALGAILVVVGSGVLVLRGSDVSNYLAFLGVSHAAASTDTGVQTGQQRTMLLWMGWQMWQDHPLLGIGLDRSNTGFEPYLEALKRRFPGEPAQAYPSTQNPWGVQNYYGQLAADTGIVGFVLGLAVFGAGLLLGARQAFRSSFAGLIAVCWIVVAAGTWNALGIVAGIPLDALTWIGLGLAAAAIPAAAATAEPAGTATAAR
jgi:O-Antigen ligase